MVLTRNGKVISKQLESDGVETPLDQEIEFDDANHRDRCWVVFPRDTWLRVTRYTTDDPKGGRTYYVLSNERR